MEKISGGELSLNEIYVIEAVIRAQKTNENNFSTVASLLDITLGALTTAYNKLEKKGYLSKKRDEKDKRVYFIIPTEIAYSVNDKHMEFNKNIIDGMAKRLPVKDLDHIADALHALSEYFNELF